jgi:hypothetical protein
MIMKLKEEARAQGGCTASEKENGSVRNHIPKNFINSSLQLLFLGKLNGGN